jgi:hypothetical protein
VDLRGNFGSLFFFIINNGMTIITKTPQNPNPLHPNKFQLTFSRAPHIQYFCQSVSVPGISLSEVPRQTPFVDLYSPGEKAIYDVFNVTFIVDEQLSGWIEIHDWIRAMTFPEKFEEYLNLQKQSRYVGNPKTPQFSDASLTLLSSSNTPTWRFKLIDCFPTSISAFVMSAQDSPDNIVTADATFRFAYFNIEKLF